MADKDDTHSTNKTSHTLLYIVIALILIGMAVGGFLYYSHTQGKRNTSKLSMPNPLLFNGSTNTKFRSVRS